MRKTASFLSIAILPAFIETLLYFPLLLLTAVSLMPSSAGAVWLCSIPLLYIAGYAATSLLNLTRLYRVLLFTAIGAFGFCYLLFSSTIALIAAIPITAIALFRGARLNGAPWGLRFGMPHYGVGMFIYFVVSIALPFIDWLEPYAILVGILGAIALVITLLMCNGMLLRQETFSKEEKPALAGSVLRHNRVQVLLLLVLAVILAMFQRIEALLRWVRDQIAAWLNSLQSDTEPQPAQEPPAETPEQGMPLPTGETSWIWIWLERIFMVIMTVLLIGAVCYLIYKIGVKFKPLMQRLSHWLNSRLGIKNSPLEQGYVDEVESLAQPDSLRGKLRSKLRSSRGQRAPADASNEEQVRYLYRSWIARAMRKGYQPKTYYSPRETLRDLIAWSKREDPTTGMQLAQLYEEVRYGGKRISAQQLKDIVDKLTMNK